MPSAKILAEKQEVVKQLAESFKAAQTLVLAEYRGLTVEQDTQLRSELRKGDVEYKVVKNTLGRLAAKEAGLDDLVELFVGPTAIALSVNDPVNPAKILKKFEDQFEPLKIKGGATEGRVLAHNELMQLATVPDLDMLYAMLVGALSGPMRGLAVVTKAIAEKCEAEGVETPSQLASNGSASVEAPAAEESKPEEPAASTEAPAAPAEEAPAAEPVEASSEETTEA